jgi:ribosomal protein S18 acetylase RimI-like enzyme
MSAVIVPFEEKFLPEIREIFFESSTRKKFKDEHEEESFFYKYVGFYLQYYPELAFVAHAGMVLGYVLGAPTSDSLELQKIQSHLKIFESQFKRYPAHLHINCHHESRGMGIGAQLVQQFEGALLEKKIQGLHIMTGPDALNKNFYKKLGFDHEVLEDFHGSRILFMGKSLPNE